MDDPVAMRAGTRLLRSPVNYWGEFALDIPLGVVLTYWGLQYHDIPRSEVFLTLFLGLCMFSYVEYTIHRWLFHGSIRFVVQAHRAHHDNPQGYDALPFFLPSLVILSLTGLLVLLTPEGYAFLVSGAMAFGYVIYGLSHFSIHHARFHQPLARRWAANHLIHHYHPECNFGVTTPFWDLILGTFYAVPKNNRV